MGSAGSNGDRVRLLVSEGEGLTTEFKEKYTAHIDEDIVAFANGKGGTLLLGVRDNGTVVGETLTNDLKGRINSLARNCKPSVAVSLAQVGEVVTIEVEEGVEKPYSCGSGYYRRLDGTTQKMSHDELRIMFAENEPLPFEEKTVKGFTFDDVSSPKYAPSQRKPGFALAPLQFRTSFSASKLPTRNGSRTLVFFSLPKMSMNTCTRCR